MNAQKIVFKILAKIKYGTLTVILPNTTEVFTGANTGISATIKINDENIFQNIILKGDIGFAEDYMQGNWETDNLPDLLSLITLNQQYFDEIIHGNIIFKSIFFFKHFLNRNTIKKSKNNISYHYDLGNDFYKIWLDPTMTYSSAIFEQESDSLELAQQNKYQRIINNLSNNTKSVLEIGCGWGGFAQYAAKNNLNVTGLTISREQKDYLEQISKTNNLEQQIKIKLQDYRNEKGKYDNIVSIEMFEAVGEKYWQNFFTTIKNSLKETGNALIQTITIDNKIFNYYRKRSDFIQQHIFPGGMLPSKEIFIKTAEKYGLHVNDSFNFGHDYAKTLSLWLDNFDANIAAIKNLGYSEEFIKKWRFYLSYCIAGFSSNRTDVFQFRLSHQNI